MSAYADFLTRKRSRAGDAGFHAAVGLADLYDFQRDIVHFATRRGRSAIFAECGLGKTPMQLEWARLVTEHTAHSRTARGERPDRPRRRQVRDRSRPRPEHYPGGIRETDVLNAAVARDAPDERHIAPLQLGVIERAVKLWSNPGDLVFSPFAGIGSEGYGALRADRRFVGIELKPSYFQTAIRNLSHAEGQLSLLGEAAI